MKMLSESFYVDLFIFISSLLRKKKTQGFRFPSPGITSMATEHVFENFRWTVNIVFTIRTFSILFYGMGDSTISC